MTSQSAEEECLLKIQAKFNKLLSLNKCNHISSSDTTMLLNELILRLCDLKKRDEELSSCIQDIVATSLELTSLINYNEPFKVSKMCTVWEHVLNSPTVALSSMQSELLITWIADALKNTNHLVMVDILNCLAAAVKLREIKLTKGLEDLLVHPGCLIKNIEGDVSGVSVATLKIFCNFANCSGEKDWSPISKNSIETCIQVFLQVLERYTSVDFKDSNVKALVLCFFGLENTLVRFTSWTLAHLESMLGLARFYMLFGITGSSVKYTPIRPSSLPQTDFLVKSDQNKSSKVRKKRTSTKTQSKSRTQDSFGEVDEIDAYCFQEKTKPSKTMVSSSDSELSDSDTQTLQCLRESQAKVRSSALKMLSAAFKFCEQRSVMGYWSSFLPDSSQVNVLRSSLVTPILKDSSVKVRCSALVALSSLLQAIQPTLSMASYQERNTGAFIPLSQTLAETIIAVQRSLLLAISAEQSASALIQLFKCLAVAASVFPYDKLPLELVSKTVLQCTPFLGHKDPDVKVACLSVLRILLCSRSSQPNVVQLFKDEGTSKCWLLEHCLSLIDSQSGFPLTLESLLVIGETARSNIQITQPYLQHIARSVCHRLLTDHDSGIQIRCTKALALIGASILQEMEKEDSDQLVTRDEAAQLWIYIIRNGLAEVLQTASVSPLRAEACAALATVGSQIFECLPRELRVLYVTLTLGCADDTDSGVRAASIRTLGFAVTFNTLNDDASFLLDSSEKILPLLKDSNLLVALNASWALGNLADTLDKDKTSLMDELPRNFLSNLIRAAIQAAQGPMKVRCNGIRALGIFVKITTDVPAQGSEMATLLEQAITIVAKQATVGNFMKNRWNACYACGNILLNHNLLTAFSHWMEILLDSLLTVFRSCPNFKVRISAANAMLNLNRRELLSSFYVRIWFALLESLANSEHIEEFAEFQHHETMCRQICNTLCKLITLMSKEDLSQLHEPVTKYYDACSSHFGKFLKSLLPEQLELVIEASDYVRQFDLKNDLFSESQKATIALFQELLVIP